VNQVEAWIDFGRGPMFRLAFSLMVLGLLRIFLLTLWELRQAYRQNADKIVPWKEIGRMTAGWLFPVARLWKRRPLYSVLSFLFHAGLLVVPLFLASHLLLWKQGLGFAWPAIPQPLADWLTLLVIATGPALFLSRLLDPGARVLSRRQDYLWPLLLALPFATGYICTHGAIGPEGYRWMMLGHVYSANLIMALMPFTKIAHCVLAPLSQLVTAISWKFPEGAGDRVAATLGHSDRPTWAEKSRLEGPDPAPVPVGREAQPMIKEVCSR
jgi:nitrate reductase gamma subunit